MKKNEDDNEDADKNYSNDDGDINDNGLWSSLKQG